MSLDKLAIYSKESYYESICIKNQRKVPYLSISAIEKAIAKMVEEGRLEKMGSGKTTYYVVKL